MIVDSDNVATGEVVDRISGAPNAPATGTDADTDAWIEQRRYTERVLESAGLLGSQRLFTKTYPTNSGEEPAELDGSPAAPRSQRDDHGPGLGADAQRRDGHARAPGQGLHALVAAQAGVLRPQQSRRRSAAGSVHENKVGCAFDTLQDVMYAELPNGQRLVISAFTNGWDSASPNPGTSPGSAILRLGCYANCDWTMPLAVNPAMSMPRRQGTARSAGSGTCRRQGVTSSRSGMKPIPAIHMRRARSLETPRPASKKSRRSTSRRGAAAGSGSATFNSTAARPRWC